MPLLTTETHWWLCVDDGELTQQRVYGLFQLYLVRVRHLAAAAWQLHLMITFIRHNTEMPAGGRF